MMLLYNLVLTTHIAAAVVLIGGSILVGPAVRRWIRKADRVSDIARWLVASKPLSVANPISAFALLGTGIYLAALGHWWRAGWVQVAIGFWIVNSVLGARLVEPSMKRIAELTFGSSTNMISLELDRARRSRWLDIWSDVMLANDIGILYLMTNKPGLVGSIVAIGATNGIVFVYRTVARRVFDRTPHGSISAPVTDSVHGPVIAR